MTDYKEIGGSATNETGSNEDGDLLRSIQGKVSETGGKVGGWIGTTWQDKIQPMLPDVSKVYLEPLQAEPRRSLGERYNLVMQSYRPWGQFFNVSEFNLAPVDQVKKRFEHNYESYFYNYFLLTLLHLLIFSLLHVTPVIVLAVYATICYVLFVQFPGDIPVGSIFVIDDLRKKVIVVLLGLGVVLYGGFLTLLFSVSIFYAVLVLIHATIRDDDDYGGTDIEG